MYDICCLVVKGKLKIFGDVSIKRIQEDCTLNALNNQAQHYQPVIAIEAEKFI